MLHRIAGIALALVVAAGAIGDAAPIEPGKPVRIMPLGDSITFGTPDLGYGGYRRLLGTLLAADGYMIDFVGSRRSGYIPHPNNEGHVGWTIPQLKNGIDANRWLETYRPDLVLLHIGTNDIFQGKAATAAGNLVALLDDILMRLPDARVIVAQIVGYRQPGDRDHLAFNAAIPGIVASKGPRVFTVGMQELLEPSDYADGVHPNAAGYDKMARAWEAAIRAAGR
jgi:lysophospholipase L1-like esterase